MCELAFVVTILNGEEPTLMTIKKEVLDELMAGYEKPEDLLGDEGLFKQLKKALLDGLLGPS